MKKMVYLSIILTQIILNAGEPKSYNFENDLDKNIIRELKLLSPDYSTVVRNASDVVDHFKYFPVFKNLIYEYEYESTNFTGKKKITVTTKSYSEKDGLSIMEVKYYNKKGNIVSKQYTIKITERGIIASDILTLTERIEIPIPLFKDKRWSENGYSNRVIGFSSKVETLYKNFDNCMKILSTSESAKIERFYAPDIGLVKQIFKSEERTDILTIVSFNSL